MWEYGEKPSEFTRLDQWGGFRDQSQDSNAPMKRQLRRSWSAPPTTLQWLLPWPPCSVGFPRARPWGPWSVWSSRCRWCRCWYGSAWKRPTGFQKNKAHSILEKTRAYNTAIILLFSSKKELLFKVLLVATMLLSVLAYFLFDWFTLFWAEWVSFAIIAFHYIVESRGVIDQLSAEEKWLLQYTIIEIAIRNLPNF